MDVFAKTVIQVFQGLERDIQLLTRVGQDELNRADTSTLFRGNSLFSKMLDNYMKLEGMEYLHCTLQPFVQKVLGIKKRFSFIVPPVSFSLSHNILQL